MVQAQKKRVSDIVAPIIHLELALHGSFKEAGEPLSPAALDRKMKATRAFLAMVAPNFELASYFDEGKPEYDLTAMPKGVARGLVYFFENVTVSEGRPWLGVFKFWNELVERAD